MGRGGLVSCANPRCGKPPNVRGMGGTAPFAAWVSCVRCKVQLYLSRSWIYVWASGASLLLQEVSDTTLEATSLERMCPNLAHSVNTLCVQVMINGWLESVGHF